MWTPDLSSWPGLICCWRNSENFPSEPRCSPLAGTLTPELPVQWNLFVFVDSPVSVSLSPRCMSVYRPVCQFFRALVQPEYSAVTDVYVLMFLADTVDFIIIVFGFWAFGVNICSLFSETVFNFVDFSLIYFIWLYFTETLGSCWHHFLSLRRSSSWSVFGHGPDPVWYVYLSVWPPVCLSFCVFTCVSFHLSVCRDYGDWPGSVFEEDRFGEAGFPGDSGFWNSLLDVFHPADGHWEVTHLYLLPC